MMTLYGTIDIGAFDKDREPSVRDPDI